MKSITSFKKEIIALCMISFYFTALSQTFYKDYVDGSIYFKMRDDVKFNVKSYRGKVEMDALPFLSSIRSKFRVTEMLSPFQAADSYILKRTFRLEFADYHNVDKIIDEIMKTGLVEYAEKVPYDRIEYVPNDPSYTSNQWYLTKISAAKAWDYSKGDPKITVAIVDNAIAINHPDLKANIWVNPGEIAGNGIDDDNNGYIDDINGWDAGDNDNNPSPSSTGYSHGTHCAGDAAAVGDNNTGIASIGFNVSIMAVKAQNDGGSTTGISKGYEGVTYAANAGADVISLSWGGSNSSQTAQNTTDYAYSKGCVILAAAGNSNVQTKFYPAAYPNVISVASSDSQDKKSSFSNYGDWIDITAPGSSIYSTYTSNNYTGYGSISGTSMACPIAAGLCGLMLSLNPTLTQTQVESCLKSSATDIYPLNSAYAGKLGAGRINAEAAMKCVSSTAKLPPVAQFSADATTNCTGVVKFTDMSSNGPTSWLWQFGDGSSSTQQNPTHTYTVNSVYTVSLTATNANGSHSEVKTSYITINKPAKPAVTGDQRCGAGPVKLSATGNYTLNWYTDPSGGSPVNTGSTYSPAITSATTYYVANEQVKPVQKTGEPDNSKTGGYLSTPDRRLIFDVLDNMVLKSVAIYADSTGTRVIEVLNGSGAVVASQSFNATASGMHRVNLNFNLSPGTGYAIKLAPASAVFNLYRNSGGGLSYPYTLSNLVSIKSSDASAPNDYYYFFYDWEVQAAPCVSERAPVTATVDNCTGIAESGDQEAFILYPNPAQDIFYIKGENKNQTSLKMEIVNILGEIVMEKTFSAGGNFTVPVNIGELRSGIYMISLVSGGQKSWQRLVKE